MRKEFPSRRRGLTLAVMIALAGVSMPLAAQQDEPEVEEVIVTGSYIRGSALDAPSPVNVIEPLIAKEPVTSAVEVVYSMCVPPSETLIKFPALSEFIPGNPLPTEKCALPVIASSKVKSA